MRWTRPCRGWAPWTRPCPSARRWKRCSLRARGSCPRCARCSRTETGMTPVASAAVALGGLTVGAVLVWRQVWGWRGLRAVRRRFPARIDRYQHAGRPRIRAALLADPEIAAAVAAHVGATGETVDAAWARVRVYVDEIVPSFDLLAYYRLRHAAARVPPPLPPKVAARAAPPAPPQPTPHRAA